MSRPRFTYRPARRHRSFSWSRMPISRSYVLYTLSRRIQAGAPIEYIIRFNRKPYNPQRMAAILRRERALMRRQFPR